MKMWIFLCIEHGMLLFKYGLETLINDIPSDVRIQLKRNEFLVSKVSKGCTVYWCCVCTKLLRLYRIASFALILSDSANYSCGQVTCSRGRFLRVAFCCIFSTIYLLVHVKQPSQHMYNLIGDEIYTIKRLPQYRILPSTTQLPYTSLHTIIPPVYLSFTCSSQLSDQCLKRHGMRSSNAEKSTPQNTCPTASPPSTYGRAANQLLMIRNVTKFCQPTCIAMNAQP